MALIKHNESDIEYSIKLLKSFGMDIDNFWRVSLSFIYLDCLNTYEPVEVIYYNDNYIKFNLN